MVAAQGRSGNGATYTWSNTTAQENDVYNYWLVEVATDGTTTEYGPVRVNAPTLQMKNTIFLPLAMR